MLQRFIQLFSSVRLTVTCLVLGCVIVFWGTLAQVELGLYRAQSEIFRSFLIYWHPAGTSLSIPVFPGGYLVGGVLLINLLVAHVRYYQPGKRKFGIALIHLGVVLLLGGQMVMDYLSRESTLHLRLDETRNYSESARASELAVVDVTDPRAEQVLAIPGRRLARRQSFQPPGWPFPIRVLKYFANSAVGAQPGPGFEPVRSTAGFGSELWWRELPRETALDKTDVPSALVAVGLAGRMAGTFLVSEWLDRPQTFAVAGREYQLVLRPERFYLPFSLQLLEFKHDKYPGTDLPKNFSSRVRLRRADDGEDREVLIFMNNPLRYGGETFYQASFDPDDRGSVLQVVRNPGWFTPYLACGLVGAGLLIQFLGHLIPFLKRSHS